MSRVDDKKAATLPLEKFNPKTKNLPSLPLTPPHKAVHIPAPAQPKGGLYGTHPIYLV